MNHGTGIALALAGLSAMALGCGDGTEVGTGAAGPGAGGTSGVGGAGAGGDDAGGGLSGGGGGDVIPPDCVVFVDGDAGSDAASGRSWTQARATVTAGLDAVAALTCSDPQLWVREGTYTPTAATDRAASFVLVPGVPVYGGFDGSEALLDERDVTAHPTILSGDIGVPGDASDNSFHVVTGAEGARLDGFTVRDGRADGAAVDDARGAGLDTAGHSMTTAACTFTANATGDGDSGGMASLLAGGGAAVYHEAGTLTVLDSHFEDNTTGRGGSLATVGGTGGDGGAILCTGTGSLVIEGSVFANNRAGDGGSTTLVMSSSGASGSGGDGGAIAFKASGSLTVRSSTFTGNRSGDGGDTVNEGPSSATGGGGRGGAIAFVTDGSVTIEDATFTNNRTGKGGDSAITIGGAAHGSGGPGAGLAIVGDATAEVRQSTFEANITGPGGDTTSTNSGSGGEGGPGGAISFVSAGPAGSLTLASVVMRQNETGRGSNTGGVGGRGGPGAGLHVQGASALEVRDVNFEGNVTGLGGAGNNIAGSGGPGGGAHVTQTDTFRMSDVTFVSNVTGDPAPGGNLSGFQGNGGGLFLLPRQSTVIASVTFHDNEAYDGGGLFVAANGSGGGSVTLANGVFTDNTAMGSAGGFFLVNDGSTLFRAAHCTIANNSATFNGGGVFYAIAGSSSNMEPVSLSNSIVWGNSANQGDQLVSGSTGVVMTVSYNTIEGGCPTTFACSNNLLGAPAFTNPTADDYTLATASPARDAGNVALLPADEADVDADADLTEALPLDRAGNARVVGAGVDLGAFEAP